MLTVSSAAFLKEFTLYANQANDDGETYIIQRGNGKNVVVMSLDTYNERQKELFLLKKHDK